MSVHIPNQGDRFSVSVLRGYRLVQNRPFECRPVCRCGECNGHTTVYDGTVERVIYWADNSIEVMVRCDDGELRYRRLVGPHGDVCF
jgi:hypothetical protein